MRVFLYIVWPPWAKEQVLSLLFPCVARICICCMSDWQLRQIQNWRKVKVAYKYIYLLCTRTDCGGIVECVCVSLYNKSHEVWRVSESQPPSLLSFWARTRAEEGIYGRTTNENDLRARAACCFGCCCCCCIQDSRHPHAHSADNKRVPLSLSLSRMRNPTNTCRHFLPPFAARAWFSSCRPWLKKERTNVACSLAYV